MTQDSALSILKTGANVFLTGAPGSGKTYTLNRYVDYLISSGIEVAITASTGIAATHIGGMTIHSWSGIGIRREMSARDLDDLTSRESASKRIKRAQVLVIDEISMLDARVLNTVDIALRAVRGKEEPFGGMQVIFVGDFFQLPPISHTGEDVAFAFQAEAWRRADPIVCYLSEQFRQEDQALLSILGAIRTGQDEPAAFEALGERMHATLDLAVEPTRLYTHNVDVDRLNTERLTNISGRTRTSFMTSKGKRPLIESLKKHCLSPEQLVLKEGAAVMCTKNNFDAGFVNGTLGVVVGFDGPDAHPIIETAHGKRLTIAPMDWSIEENGKPLATITQVPLRLAWAITIHKSQGMTLDAAVVDLSKAFEYGQGYVALSRVRALSGLSLLGITPKALSVHPGVLARDSEFKALSDAAHESFDAIDAEELDSMHERFVSVLGGIRGKKAVRKKSRLSGAPDAHDSPVTLTFQLWRTGLLLPELAKERGLAPATIMGHLFKAAQSGMFMESDRIGLLAFANLSEDDAERIENAFAELSTDRLKPVFELLNGIYSYEAIHVGRILALLKAAP